MSIKKIFINKKEEQVKIKGWIISNRGNNKVRFLIINDGSTFENIQVVVKDGAEKLDNLRIGSSVIVSGKIKLTPDSKQPLELISLNLEVLKISDEDFPLQKQGMSREVLRELPHVRHRTNLFRAVMRVRSTLAQEIHNFFIKRDFLLVSSPIITSNDGEGAGETFIVDDNERKQFFGKKATLGVTGQLHAEAYANGFGKVYTFAPTFRAEKSHTSRHASEFWMIEPEIAFYDLSKIIKLADELLKEVIKNTLEKHPLEFDFFKKFVSEGLKDKLLNVIKKPIVKLDYKDVIKKLQEVKTKFKNQNIEFGLDLDTEHERYIAEELIKGPVALINYPKEIKAFYMYQNDDGKTVAAMDLLVPGIGELIGGSQRECDVKKLEKRIEELGIDKKDLEWYINLRRWGQGMSAGFGLGFERLVMYVTGIENIRDSIPFPRTPNNLKM